MLWRSIQLVLLIAKYVYTLDQCHYSNSTTLLGIGIIEYDIFNDKEYLLVLQ